MKYSILLSLGALLALVGCKPPTLYEWGNYEGSLYTLMKDPTSLDKYGKALLHQIEEGERVGKVPPGIYAEYGYVLSVTNNPGEAVKYYEKEKQRWPESARFMDKMILNGKGPKPAQTAVAPATQPSPVVQPSAAPTVVPATQPVVTPPPAPTPTAIPAPGKESR